MTESNVPRRRILAIAAATVTAGCGGQDSSGTNTDGRFAADNSRSTAREASTATTAVATESGNDSSVEMNIETQSETEQVPVEEEATAEPSDTPEQTETPSGTDRLEAARQSLTESLTVYSDAEDVDTVLDVDASVTAFDAEAVRERLSTATTRLDEAATRPDTDEETLDSLRAANEAIDELVATQVAVVDAYEQFDRAYTALFDEDFSTVKDALSKLELKRSQASTQVHLFEERTDPANFAPVDGFSERTYDVKVEQFTAEVTAFEDVHSPIEKFNDGLESFADGVERYVDSDYRGAEQKLLESLNGFEIASTSLLGVTTPSALNNKTETLRRSANALANGTDYLIESCKAGKNGNEGERQSEFRDAVDAYQRSGEANSLESYQQLVNET